MGNDGRYIRTLRVKASDESVLSGSVATLEDAFNTASLTGLPLNSMVFVRSFDLGHFSESTTSATLSLVIEKKIRELSGMAVCADEGEQGDASVVWFTDDVQPCISLAGLIADGTSPSAWYWRSAVPGWQPGMNREQIFMTLVDAAMGTSAKVSASARLLNHLLERKALDVFLYSLTSRTMAGLISKTGILSFSIKDHKQERAPVSSPLLYINAAWQRELSRWIDAWGEQDVRTLWLTYNGVLNHNPALAGSHCALDIVQQLVRTLKKENSDHRAVAHDGVITRIKQTGDCQGKSRADQMTEAVLETYQLETAGPAMRTTPAESTGMWTVSGEEERDKQSLKTDSEDPVAHMSDGRPGKTGRHCSVSHYAGLVFILPLLELTGMRDILNQNEELVEFNVPGRVLRAIVRRCGIPSSDPVYSILPDIAERDVNRIDRFVAPAVWEKLLPNPGEKEKTLYRFQTEDNPQKCVIADKTKKIILATVSATQLKMLPRWLCTCAVKTSLDVCAHPDINSIENTIQLIMGRYLRRYAGMGLQALVKRKGKMETTETHIDVLFDLHDSDVRIRRSGLDINPGWIPWFGRVVQFHYLEHEG